ncbi:MAG: electron transport complex subunit E [Cyclobacteriaceae bacterium]|nr:electron transport complex subunit E [Cyclobacteriaceae bacterium HetDA_MAG_MS6]
MKKVLTHKENFTKGVVKENPVFVLLLGLCPTLGVTTTAMNGLGMGLATLVVLIMANVVISMVRDFIPDKVRIPSFIVIIASFVTIVDLLMAAFTPGLHEELGLFIPLIVVNCIVLGRAETFASRHPILPTIVDGLGMGIGFTFALGLLGSIREILGSLSLFGFQFSEGDGMIFFILAPGAFVVLGMMIGFFEWRKHQTTHDKQIQDH